MNQNAAAVISAKVNALSAGTNSTIIADNLSRGEAADAAVSAIGVAESLASVANKGNPALASGVGLYQLSTSLGSPRRADSLTVRRMKISTVSLVASYR